MLGEQLLSPFELQFFHVVMHFLEGWASEVLEDPEVLKEFNDASQNFPLGQADDPDIVRPW